MKNERAGDMDVMHTPDGDVKMFPCLRCGRPTTMAVCGVCDEKSGYCALGNATRRATGTASTTITGSTGAKPNVLAEAEALVHGDRAEAYGPADKNHTNVVRMFDAWLECRYPDGVEHLDSYDSCVFNVMQKLSRFAHGLGKGEVHRDSLVDGAGYFGVMGKIADERAEKHQEECP